MKKAFCLALIAIAFVGCSKDRNNNPIANIREAAKDKDLQGTFAATCSATPGKAIATGFMSGGQSAVKSEKVSYTFAGANVTRSTAMFESMDCSGDPAGTFAELGDIKVDKNQKTNDGGYNIDMDFHDLHVKIRTEAGAKAANAVSLCGINDWKVGQESNVSRQSPQTNCYGAKLPRHVANIYRVDAGTLYLGEDTLGTVQNRPHSLNMSYKFQKQ